jgi:hypothetical protein
MSQHNAAFDRQVRIELLRTRAAVERETLARRIHEVGQELAPRQLMRSTLASVTGKGEGSMLSQLAGTALRHPVLSSALPSMLLGKTGGRAMRAVAIGLTGWQLFKAWRGSRAGEKGAGEKDEAGKAE